MVGTERGWARNGRAWRWRKRHATAESPKLFIDADPEDPTAVEAAWLDLEWPSLSMRQKWNAQDPLSSVYHWLVCIRVKLTALFGARMCYNCQEYGHLGKDCPQPDQRKVQRSAARRLEETDTSSLSGSAKSLKASSSSLAQGGMNRLCTLRSMNTVDAEGWKSRSCMKNL